MLGPTPGKQLPKLVRTSELKTAWATVLVYTQPRWGKTNAIRTLVKHGFKVAVLATDQGDSMGLQTISDLDIPVIPVSTWDEATLVFAELAKQKHKGKCTYQGEEIDVLVNDSLSGFGSIWMKRALEVMGKEEVGVAHQGWDPRRVYAYIPEKGRQTTNALMDLACHLILLCRETLAEEGEGQARIQYMVPELPGAKLPRELPGWLDAVVFGKIINGERVLVTEAEGKVVAGIRSPENRRYPKYIKGDYGLLIKSMMGDDAALADLKWVSPASKTSSGNSPAPSTTRK